MFQNYGILKNGLLTSHNVGETTQFFGTQKQSNIGQFKCDFKKM
jgi:hypothetical protein